MEKEHKELLIKDLCARLPYGVKVKHEEQDFSSTLLWVDAEGLSAGRKADKKGVGSDWGRIEFIKPYLRPMSSMTEEEDEKRIQLGIWRSAQTDGGEVVGITSDYRSSQGFQNALNFLLGEHFDIFGLIPKGLAIEVTEENNPYNLKEE